jgi:hypothetical protein
MVEPLPPTVEPQGDYRARVARRQTEAAHIREQERLEQTSTINPPDLRIRIWERLHQLTMPSDSSHRLLRVIAAQTGLTMAQVHAEQHQRANPAAAGAPVRGPDPPAAPAERP